MQRRRQRRHWPGPRAAASRIPRTAAGNPPGRVQADQTNHRGCLRFLTGSGEKLTWIVSIHGRQSNPEFPSMPSACRCTPVSGSCARPSCSCGKCFGGCRRFARNCSEITRSAISASFGRMGGSLNRSLTVARRLHAVAEFVIHIAIFGEGGGDFLAQQQAVAFSHAVHGHCDGVFASPSDSPSCA